MAFSARPAIRSVPRVVTKPTTIKPMPKASIGKPIIKSDTHVSAPKAAAPKTSVVNSAVPKSGPVVGPVPAGDLSFRNFMFYHWLFGNHHSKVEQTVTQDKGGSFGEEKESNSFMGISLVLMVIVLFVAVVVWWNKRKDDC